MELLDDYKQEDAQLMLLGQKIQEARKNWWFLLLLQLGLLALYVLFKLLFYSGKFGNLDGSLSSLAWLAGWLILGFLLRLFWVWYRGLWLQAQLHTLQTNQPSPLAHNVNDWLYLILYAAVHFGYKYLHFHKIQDYIFEIAEQSRELALVVEQDFDYAMIYFATILLGCAVGYSLIKYQSRHLAQADKWAAIAQLGWVAAAKLALGFGFLILLFYTRLSATRYDEGSFIPPPTFEELLQVHMQSMLTLFFFCNALPLLILYYYLDWKEAQQEDL